MLFIHSLINPNRNTFSLLSILFSETNYLLRHRKQRQNDKKFTFATVMAHTVLAQIALQEKPGKQSRWNHKYFTSSYFEKCLLYLLFLSQHISTPPLPYVIRLFTKDALKHTNANLQPSNNASASQEERECTMAYLSRHAVFRFQKWVVERGFNQNRFGWLYGRFCDDNSVQVDAIYEPPQMVSQNLYWFLFGRDYYAHHIFYYIYIYLRILKRYF